MFPKRIVDRTKCLRGPHATGVFEIPVLLYEHAQ